MSWVYNDLTSSALDVEPLRPRDGQPFYPSGRHLLTGVPESLKTLIACWTGLQHLRAGGGDVLHVDFEMGPERLRRLLDDLGATEDELRRWHHTEPTVAPTAQDVASLTARGVDFVILDSAAGAYDLMGLDDSKRGSAERVAQAWVRPFDRAGMVTHVIDHVTKADRGRDWPIGSERKLGVVDVAYRFDVTRALSRGGTGVVRVKVLKDRSGWLQRGTEAGEFRLTSDPVTHRLTCEYRPSLTTRGAPEDGAVEKLLAVATDAYATIDQLIAAVREPGGAIGDHPARDALEALTEAGQLEYSRHKTPAGQAAGHWRLPQRPAGVDPKPGASPAEAQRPDLRVPPAVPVAAGTKPGGALSAPEGHAAAGLSDAPDDEHAYRGSGPSSTYGQEATIAAEVATWPGATAPEPLVPVLAGRAFDATACRHEQEWLARDGKWRCQSCDPPSLPGEVERTRPAGRTERFDTAASESNAAREGTP